MQPSIRALEEELHRSEITAQRRLKIGKLLDQIGDNRDGVGIKKGLPDIKWLPVASSGMVEIQRIWRTEDPKEEDKVIYRQTFMVEPFYIAKHLVTYSQYQAFVEAEDGFANLAWWTDMPNAYKQQPVGQQPAAERNSPRGHISWYQCLAFARWLNCRLDGLELPHPDGASTMKLGSNAEIRLPTEWEWQWAAQNGAEARVYPWGAENQLDVGLANTVESGLHQATAVGMYPLGAAACGALDMAGNLMEWCANDKTVLQTIDVASSASKVLRGGDWGYEIENATCGYCDDEEPSCIDRLNGCRLVLCTTALPLQHGTR